MTALTGLTALRSAMRPHRRRFAAAAVLGVLAAMSAVALLGTAGWLISRAAQMPAVLELTVAAVLVRTFALGRAVFRYAERLVAHDAALRALTTLRIAVYSGLERLTPNGLARFTRGDLLNRLGVDVDAGLDYPVRVALPFVQAAVVSVGTAAFLWFLIPATGAAVGLLAVVVIGVVPWMTARSAASAGRLMAPAQSELSASVVQVLDASAELSVYGAGDSATQVVRKADKRLVDLSNRTAVGVGLGGALTVAGQGAAVVAVLSLTVPAVSDGRLPAVWLAVAVFLPLALFDVLATLPGAAAALQRLRGSAQRLAEIEALARTTAPVASSRRLPASFTGLELRGVRARWAGATDDCLHGIDLNVAPGEHVALVGPSGSGKSSLAAVVAGLLAYSGTVAVSGVEVRDADEVDMRSQVGVLSQRAHLFSTTLGDNVRVGDATASVGEVERALRRVGLGQWVDELPQGVDSEVGAYGLAVSGGQRQRIALARLLLGSRQLLILDEPTEHVDPEAAVGLVTTIRDVFADSTLLVITHRLSEAQHFDRIVEIVGGGLVAEGSHAELLTRGGWYAEHWRSESSTSRMDEVLATVPIGSARPLTISEGGERA